MTILNVARKFTERIFGPRVVKAVRRRLRRPLAGADVYRSSLAGRRGLEIGGPSEVFTDEGRLPIYRDLDHLDNCLFAGTTLWTGAVQAGRSFEFHPSKNLGSQFICEAANLEVIQDSTYECVLASHCLEHVANPLRALAEWKRVLKNDGLLLLLLPHRDGTFDHRRPVTPFSHMIEDYEQGKGEDDLTHVPEILALHDLALDKPAGTLDQFRNRCLDNFRQRAIHHHVFDTRTAVTLVDHAGFQVLRVDAIKPFHIVILAIRRESKAENAAFLGANAEYHRTSPFASDRPAKVAIRE
jgi:SAM-dependent methyltransferase